MPSPKPVLTIIAFNRPEKLRQLLHSLVGQRFRAVYAIVDGPREGNKTDRVAVKRVRKLIEEYSWGCRVHTHYAKKNMGCKLRVSSGISWVFTKEPDAIILEDDLLPDPSFILYATELLEKYRHDERVMHISGFNAHGMSEIPHTSYHVSRYPNIWGWATWARAWKYYRHDVPDWLEQRDAFMKLPHKTNTANNWALKLRRAYDGTLDTWDFQWLYAVMMRDGLCINPNQNLITNTGFDSQGTHQFLPFLPAPFTGQTRGVMKFPLQHPIDITPVTESDLAYENSLDPHPIYAFKDFVYHEVLHRDIR